jgi:N-acetylneuraminic acid mutarotase
VAVPASKAATPTEIKTGVLSPLQEDEGRYYTTVAISKSKDHLKLATVSWFREPVEAWRTREISQVPSVIAATNTEYSLPKISDGAECVNDTWTATSSPPDGYEGITAVWSGAEMIVWGGWLGGPSYLGTGGRYNPSTDTWTATSNTDAPSSRSNHTAVWTGSEMIVWGGFDFNDGYLNTGGRYNPSTDSWVATSTTNAPAARESHTGVWTGNEMIVWGGYDLLNNIYFDTGGKYNPDTDTWVATNTGSAPIGRAFHTAVWAGTEMIVWGGEDQNFSQLNTGGRYDPTTNSWLDTSTTNAPVSREGHTAVWTGDEMIVWGGFGGSNNLNTGEDTIRSLIVG